MTPELPITQHNGMFSFMLHPCSSGILAHILDPTVPFVWLQNHTPKRYVQWWRTQASLSESGLLHDLEVRSMAFDLQLSTNRFLELLPEFKEHGVMLFQMSRRVPDTLTLDGVAESAVNRVLIQNGLHLRFYLPHVMEYAQLAAPNRQVLERILQKVEVRELVVEDSTNAPFNNEP